MRLYILGNEVEASLEDERTIGELSASVDSWLAAQGFKASRVLADDRELDPGTPLEGIGRIDVEAVIDPARAYRSLATRLRLAVEAAPSCGDVRDPVLLAWLEGEDTELSAAYESFLSSDASLLGDGKFSGEQASERGTMLASLLDERAKEREDGLGELGRTFKALKPLLPSLADLSFMLQTGKDAEAYSTLLAFAELASKLVRCLRASLPSLEGLSIDGSGIGEFAKDLSGHLDELLGSLERKDLVGLGDVAEYEIAPRLAKLHEAFDAAMAEA